MYIRVLSAEDLSSELSMHLFGVNHFITLVASKGNGHFIKPDHAAISMRYVGKATLFYLNVCVRERRLRDTEGSTKSCMSFC